MVEETPIAVVGATGQQGGAVVDALLEQGAAVRAVVRSPDGDAARALAARGVEVVRGDQEDRAALTSALRGTAAMFLMTTFAGPDATDGEVRRGRIAAQAAADAAVPRVVYSSVGGAERETGIPHFESKRRVEERLEQLVPAVFVRPVFFMENLTAQLPAGGAEAVLRLPMPDGVPLQLVAVRDIGRVAARLLTDPDSIDGRAVEIAGDELTGSGIAERVAARSGAPARYEALPLDVLDDDDQRRMFAWFASLPAYRADFAATRRLDPQVLDLAGWLAEQG